MAADIPATQDHVLVVGGSRGIGLATARLLASEGLPVISWSRTAPDSSSMSSTLQKRILWYSVDVRDPVATSSALMAHRSAGQRIDTIIYAAGIARWGAIGAQAADEWADVISANATGAFNVLTSYLAAFSRHPRRVVGLASDASHGPAALRSAYHASKAALASLLESYRLEARPHGTIVTILYLGKANTTLSSRSSEANAAALQPSEVAKVISDVLKYPARIEIRSIEVSSVEAPFGNWRSQ